MERRLNLTGTSKDYFSDGVHPTKFTYQTWAKDLANFLADNERFCQDIRSNDKKNQ
jgi:lysophospholipase L1-like esterase